MHEIILYVFTLSAGLAGVCLAGIGLVCLTALSLSAQPAQVILFRHAEEPSDPPDVHLSSRGAERARALVSLLGTNSPYTTNAPIVGLYATRVTKQGHSQRTGETLAPLSQALDLPVQTWFGAEDYALLARSLGSRQAYRGKTVIICWTHHHLAELAQALGVKPKPPPWKDRVFDRLWIINFHDGSSTFRDIPQRLLRGDSKH